MKRSESENNAIRAHEPGGDSPALEADALVSLPASKSNLKIALRMTLALTILLGLAYPLLVTVLAQAIFPAQANGELIRRDGKIVGSRLIGQAFSSPAYFHSRPSAAGRHGYNPMNSGGSNLGPTNRLLIERVESAVRKLRAENPHARIPVDLVTSSASGLDPDISPAAAAFQIPLVARERGIRRTTIEALVRKYTKSKQFGFLGEPRVNVLELNLALDRLYPLRSRERSPSGRSGPAAGSSKR